MNNGRNGDLLQGDTSHKCRVTDTLDVAGECQAFELFTVTESGVADIIDVIGQINAFKIGATREGVVADHANGVRHMNMGEGVAIAKRTD